MCRWRCDDVEQVRLRIPEHLVKLVKGGHPRGKRPFPVPIASTDQSNPSRFLPGLVVKLREISRSQTRDAQDIAVLSHALLLTTLRPGSRTLPEF